LESGEYFFSLLSLAQLDADPSSCLPEKSGRRLRTVIDESVFAQNLAQESDFVVDMVTRCGEVSQPQLV
jgi:hypothetical protein